MRKEPFLQKVYIIYLLRNWRLRAKVGERIGDAIAIVIGGKGRP